MSLSTRTPGHFPKTLPFDFPRAAHLPTPPETDVDAYSTVHGPYFTPSNLKSDANESFTMGGPSDTPSARPVLRKSSNLSYINSGLTRPEQRFGTHRPAATRWLVVVSAPPALALENGSTIFLTPTRHASQSVLLPLFPSLSRQLSAIAREYAFPSTTGIYLFLRLPEESVPYSSRLSEESWSILWAHVLFDERPIPGSSTGGLPIAGRLDFDIDLRKARWYDAWATAMRREFETTPLSSAPSLVNHGREDSHTTHHTDAIHDDAEDVSMPGQKRRSRHIPKKLSLIEKLDSNSSVRSLSRPVSRQGMSPPQHEAFPLHALSPIPQLDEPKSAIKVLESKVENWRASAAIAKSPLTHDEILDNTNVPNSEHTEDEGQELNLDDFTWSISSAGPPSDVPWSALSYRSDGVPSVHIASRAEGSVCLTPSTCTSWGPDDHSLASPVSSISRLPSPDIAFRGYDYIPLTPSTATSWGPPVEWDDFDFSLSSSSRVPSIDLAGRAMSSRPCTPSTATSWGAPLEYPETPITPYRVHTPDVGLRSFEFGDHSEHDWHPAKVTPVRFSESGSWKLVWPYRHSLLDSEGESIRIPSSRLGYPYFDLYPAVYPYFDIYPTVPDNLGSASGQNVAHYAAYPHFDLYPAAYPFFEIYSGYVIAPQELDGPQSVKLGNGMTSLDTDAVAYPTFEIYPGNVIRMVDQFAMEPSVKLQAQYPLLDIYPAVYPNLVIYPPVNDVEGRMIESPRSPKIVVRLPREYPCVEIYPPVYPYNLESIYPRCKVEEHEDGPAWTLSAVYPSFNLYPAVYPNFDIYPEVTSCEDVVEDVNLTSPVVTIQGIKVTLDAQYPLLEPYPPVYPDIRIYPDVEVSNDSNGDVPVKYPNFDIYPAVYPYFDIYRTGFASTPVMYEVGELALPATYPRFNIYPAVYPYFDIYSTGYSTLAEVDMVQSTSMNAAYPALNIYPAVYPYFDIYSTGYPTLAENEEEIGSIVVSPEYPHLNIYPAAYPYFDIYSSGFPTRADNERDWESDVLTIRPSYPNFNLYPAVYPDFDIYSTGQPSRAENEEVIVVELGSSYPRFNIYPPVYPHFDLYNQNASSMSETQGTTRSSSRGIRKSRKTHQELYEAVMMHLSRSSVAQKPRSARKTHEDLYNEVMFGKSALQQALRIDTTGERPTTAKRSPELRSVTSSTEPVLAVKPSDIRRGGSLNRGSQPPASNGAAPPLKRFASTSDRTTSTHNRHHSITPSPLSTVEVVTDISANGDVSPARRKPARRDSIVLEKARHWGSTGPTPLAPQAHSSPLMDDLAAFPMPPMPPLPTKSMDLNRPIAKLDRSKLPFH